MYEQFYGLRERPFGLTSNLKYFLLTPKHHEALANLEYGLAAGDGITLLLGEAGTGKTTLLRKVLGGPLRPGLNRRRCAYLNNPRLQPRELFEFVAHGFQLGPTALRSKPTFLRELEANLAEHRAQGTDSVLVVDEAQCLSDDLLEEVRLLANMETETEKLMRVVLTGQPRLGDRLNEPGLRQLKQRIGLRCVLPSLDLHETAAYIVHRLTRAGGSPAQCFSREAIIAIHHRSHGLPRTVNVVSDNALLTGFAADQRPVGVALVLEVCRDFDLSGALPDVGLLTRDGRPEANVFVQAPLPASSHGSPATPGAPDPRARPMPLRQLSYKRR